MPFCNHCGGEIPDDAAFCVRCGTQARRPLGGGPLAEPSPAAPVTPAAPAEGRRSRKKLVLLLALGLVVAVAAAVITVLYVLPNDEGHDLVVWTDARGGDHDIYAYDLTSGEERAICVADGDQSQPAVFGAWVVWADARKMGFNIYAFNLETNEEQALCEGTGVQCDPAVAEDWVVWIDGLGGSVGSAIQAYSLATGEVRKIAHHPGLRDQFLWPLSVDGNWVVARAVVARDVDGYTELFIEISAHDLATGQTRRLYDGYTPDSYAMYAPAISGDWVVWQGEGDDGSTESGSIYGGTIYAYNLRTGDQSLVRTGDVTVADPTVSGDWVAYRLNDADDDDFGDIYACNLVSGEERAVCTATGRQSNPVIVGDWVVWEDERGADKDIFGFNLVTGEERPICTAPGDQETGSTLYPE